MVKSSLYFLIMMVWYATLSGCNDPVSASKDDIGNIIAYYPLKTSPHDILENYGPMTLVNTPFRDGGLYSNGVYWNSGDTVNRCLAHTPLLDTLNLNSFTVSVWFKVDEVLPDPFGGRPVIMGGISYRWMGVILRPDTTLSLLYNNNFYVHTTTQYTMGSWQQVRISYDGATQVGRLYYDDEMIASATYVLNHGDDRFITNTNFSNGTTHLGYLRDLKIYNEADTSLSLSQY